MVRMVESVAEFDDILKEAGDKLVVVDFTATWCGPCKYIAPVFEALSKDPENKNVIFLKVDVDEVQDLCTRCEIRSMPTFQFYKKGQKLEAFSGADPDKLKSKVAALR
ncbi:thioredoxin [Lates calcarifer]|uniref:Thioredoxin n=1 Tax=Lates calcarifer TaxID=8187 RepID=A0A4W6BS07_LATCA|nr:thioredoxin [Lates calcarifer]XP_018560648.1 thioredoxin [Lates calcarifer]